LVVVNPCISYILHTLPYGVKRPIKLTRNAKKVYLVKICIEANRVGPMAKERAGVILENCDYLRTPTTALITLTAMSPISMRRHTIAEWNL
ncbi:MAG: hypothetical protein LBE74_03450, partial [Treponema sp.]|nr:hypothetical protein [Treponema sp.]